MEKVQLSLERFLPELRDLERKEIFSKDEIADIVAQRRRFEIGLASRAVKPIDYLRYIDYETKLEKLRKKRAFRIKTTTKKTLSDHSISAHVTQLHRLSTRRFPASLELWDAFLGHALAEASPYLVSRTLSTAIAMHPMHVPYWLMASRWESEGDERGLGGGNDEAARRLCMRALRFLKGSGEAEYLVWNEWIRVECAFAERLRARWALLGIAKNGRNGKEEIIVAGESSRNGKNKRRKVDTDASDDEDEEDAEAQGEGDQAIEAPALQDEQQDEEEEALKEEVQKEAASGQEAIIDGAIVRVVLDNYLASFKHSVEAYQRLLAVIRPLPSVLRLSLLKHAYTSLSAHILPSSPDYAQALHLLATRHLYDVAYNPKKAKKVQDADGKTIQVTGEKLVDAVSAGVDQYWIACRGRKGKGKSRDIAPLPVWESFCSWIEQLCEVVEEENLQTYLSANLTSALSMAPSSPFLSLLHLRHLLRTNAPIGDVLTFAQDLTKRFGGKEQSAATREQVWVARIDTVVLLADDQGSLLGSDDVEAVLEQALKAIPFSGRLWSIRADWAERNVSSTLPEMIEWFQKAVSRVLLSDAVPPIGFQSIYGSSTKGDSDEEEEEDTSLEPRELIPRRYVRYLVENVQDRSSLSEHFDRLIRTSPTLSIDVLNYILESSSQAEQFSRSTISSFRIKLNERVIQHPNVTPSEWVKYAEELLKAGQATKSTEVVRRARSAFKGTDLVHFEREWTRVVDA